MLNKTKIKEELRKNWVLAYVETIPKGLGEITDIFNDSFVLKFTPKNVSNIFTEEIKTNRWKYIIEKTMPKSMQANSVKIVDTNNELSFKFSPNEEFIEEKYKEIYEDTLDSLNNIIKNLLK